MAVVSKMRPEPGTGKWTKWVRGSCAGCGKTVYESLLTLDDCYLVWQGECPYCGAINILADTGLRGYSERGMDLCLAEAYKGTSNKEAKTGDHRAG